MDTRQLTARAATVGLALLLTACAPASTAPTTAPASVTTAPTPVLTPAGTHQSALSALKGSGTGGVSVTPKTIPQGTFDADIKVLLRSAKANTTYSLQRAPEIGRALGSDGVCQRAGSVAPWSQSDPPAPAFLTFMSGTTPQMVTTDSSGNGSLDFEFTAPTILAGTVFDVMFRLVDNVDAPTAEIRSGCFTVTVK